MKWLKDNLLGLFIGAIFSLIVSLVIINYQNRIQYLEFDIHKSESLLSKPNDIGDSIKFTVNGKVVKDISELDVEIYNNTNTDFKDLPVVIEFDQPDDFETISTIFLDQHQTKELIEAYPFKAGSKFVRFGNIVKQINRKDEPVFYMKFLLRGKSIPEFKIYAMQGGVEFKEKKKSIFGSADSSIVILSVGLSILIIIIVALTFIYYNIQIKKQIEFQILKHSLDTKFYEDLKKGNIVLKDDDDVNEGNLRRPLK